MSAIKEQTNDINELRDLISEHQANCKDNQLRASAASFPVHIRERALAILDSLPQDINKKKFSELIGLPYTTIHRWTKHKGTSERKRRFSRNLKLHEDEALKSLISCIKAERETAKESGKAKPVFSNGLKNRCCNYILETGTTPSHFASYVQISPALISNWMKTNGSAHPRHYLSEDRLPDSVLTPHDKQRIIGKQNHLKSLCSTYEKQLDEAILFFTKQRKLG